MISLQEVIGLQEVFEQAAVVAMREGQTTKDQYSLIEWIRTNCKYNNDTELYFVIGIGRVLARLETRARE